MKVKINKLLDGDAFYSIKDLLEGMIVEIPDKTKSRGCLYFSKEQFDFLQERISDDFDFKKHFSAKNIMRNIYFLYHKDLYNENLNIKCNGCDNQITTDVCPHCGEWN